MPPTARFLFWHDLTQLAEQELPVLTVDTPPTMIVSKPPEKSLRVHPCLSRPAVPDTLMAADVSKHGLLPGAPGSTISVTGIPSRPGWRVACSGAGPRDGPAPPMARTVPLPPLPSSWLRNGASGLGARHAPLVVHDLGSGVTGPKGIDGPLMRGLSIDFTRAGRALHNMDVAARCRGQAGRKRDGGACTCDIDVFLDLDVGKGEHHATAITSAGKKALDKRLPNTEPKLRELFAKLKSKHGTVLVVVDSGINWRDGP